MSEQPLAPRLRFELVGWPVGTVVLAQCPYCDYESPISMLPLLTAWSLVVDCAHCKQTSALPYDASRQWFLAWCEQEAWLASHQPYPGAL